MREIGLIAGSGQFPIIFSKAARAKGIKVYAIAHNGETDPRLAEFVDRMEWVYVGQVGRVINFFRKEGVKDVVMAGAIAKAKMFSDFRPDLKALKLLTKMIHTHDDRLLRVFARALEKEGLRVYPSTFLLPELLAPAGRWTVCKPSRSEMADVNLGWRVAKEIGRLDIGQCVVVRNGSVLAVEAIDGTDATIRRGGMLAKDRAVVVKVSKPNQDLRFDVPAVGVQTIETMHEVGAKVLAIEAGKSVVFDREEMIRLADKYNICIMARGDMDSKGISH
nr:LpxI family protein [Desulfobacterales bacterium]